MRRRAAARFGAAGGCDRSQPPRCAATCGSSATRRSETSGSASRAWAPLHSANFALDLLAYCASDLHGGAADVAASPLASALWPRSSLAAFASASSSTRPRYHELHELRLLPLASGGLAPLGSGDYVVAGAAQQALLPHLAPQFVSAACADHAKLGPSSATRLEWLRALKLRDLTLELLSRELRLNLAADPSLLHALWEHVRAKAAGGENGLGAAHLQEIVSAFGHMKLLPLRGGEVVLTHAVRHTFVLPQALLDATLPSSDPPPPPLPPPTALPPPADAEAAASSRRAVVAEPPPAAGGLSLGRRARVARRASAERRLCSPRRRRRRRRPRLLHPARRRQRRRRARARRRLRSAGHGEKGAHRGRRCRSAARAASCARLRRHTRAGARSRRALSGTGYQDEPPDLAEASPLMARSREARRASLARGV